MNLRQFLRLHALPGEKVKVVGNPRRKELLGKTGTLVRYTDAIIRVGEDEFHLTTNSLAPVDQTES